MCLHTKICMSEPLIFKQIISFFFLNLSRASSLQETVAGDWSNRKLGDSDIMKSGRLES